MRALRTLAVVGLFLVKPAQADWWQDTKDTHSLYATVFRDSHYEPQYNVGYMWMTYWSLAGPLQGGLGYSVFVFSRDDMGNRYPLPGALPAASLRYRGVELIGTYVPGFTPGGSVGYFFGRFNF
jgi:palmitoyl transferase